MDEELYSQFRTTMRAFVDREIMPFVNEWDEAGEFPRELYRKAGDLGLLGMGYPEELGGGPTDNRLKLIMTEETSRPGSGGLTASLFSHTIGLPPIAKYAHPALRDTVVPAVLRGEKISALAITEPSGGSDVANLKTKAVRDGDHFIVTGEKTFITSGMRADYYTVAVRTGGPSMGGISLLLIEREREGFTRTPLKKMGWWMSDTATLHFDAVKVPVTNLIGPENQGFRLIMENFNTERLTLAMGAYAFARVCYDEALDWARERITFGAPLVQHQVIRHKLADMRMKIEATRAWIEELGRRLDAGENTREIAGEIALIKNQATQTMQFCADQGVQILGGMGYMRGTRCERIYREVKVMMIGGGAEEIMKDLAARQFGF